MSLWLYLHTYIYPDEMSIYMKVKSNWIWICMRTEARIITIWRSRREHGIQLIDYLCMRSFRLPHNYLFISSVSVEHSPPIEELDSPKRGRNPAEQIVLDSSTALTSRIFHFIDDCKCIYDCNFISVVLFVSLLRWCCRPEIRELYQERSQHRIYIKRQNEFRKKSHYAGGGKE